MNIYYKHLILLPVWLITPFMFPISLPNLKYHIYLDSNPQIEFRSTHLESKDVYWVTDIDFCFANIIDCWQF